MYDVNSIREDFPILKRKIHGRELVYFDNAATTQRPKQVVEAIAKFYLYYNANVHRGFHTLSQEASQLFEESYEEIAKFINGNMEETILTINTTDAINIVAYGWGLRNLKKGDEIVTTVMEHHSNMLPWRELAELTGAKIKYVDITEDGELNYKDLESKITERTKIVAFTLASNVVGTINDYKKIVNLAHSVEAIVIADGAQYVPHVETDVKKMDVDFLAFSGHKMLGPTGIGILWGKKEILEEMKPFRVGGDTIKDVTLDNVVWHDLPWRFDAGTPHIAGVIGLAEAVRYLKKIGMDGVRAHDIELVKHTIKLMKEIDDIEILGPLDPEKRTGLVAFNIKGLHHHIVAKALDMYGIAVRSGGHCAHPLHYRLNYQGSVRASYYIYNTKEEVDYFVEKLQKIISVKERLATEPVENVCTGT
ncbi:SufS family cysteine desulfurase [Fervidicoccus fontis]|uniref:Cysteine desulfurase n=1 Tax=Fervidicoccus fontis TaxID=683846 RepID=A0A2J6N2Y3_9CREN|nr:SufS family cysteine desulfurase [Fervidicoccus fontis]PMB75659.1 MAG: cysteine desulfurase [Fervidicoccus fontis]PMB76579.1 MAG: cysteine desulfurase [Fervidicoccus fontis]HEW63971.1 SufS family cysteine desulfurase [Fervidicoccus fontis]